MGAQDRISRTDRFAGLSDRSEPVNLTRIESPDLENVDFFDRTLAKRRGFVRIHDNSLVDSSVLLDGYNDFLKIPYIDAYDIDVGVDLEFSIDVVLNEFPATTITIVGQGLSGGAGRILELRYVPTLNGNLGAWELRCWDLLQNIIIVWIVNDGDVGQSQVGAYRHISFTNVTGFNHVLTVVDDQGNEIGADTKAIFEFEDNDDFPIFIGCASVDGLNPPAEGFEGSYSHITVAEFRLSHSGLSSSALQVFKRELASGPQTADSEIGNLSGYWRLNDGVGVEFTDLINGNTAVAERETPVWISDPALVAGSSALRFRGQSGHITSAVGNVVQDLFTDAATGQIRWSFTFLYTPEVAQGETTVRDQTLFWSGTNQNDPAPLGIRIVSDNLQVTFVNSAGTTLTSTPLVGYSFFSRVGTRQRISLEYDTVIGPQERILIKVFDSGSGTTFSGVLGLVVNGNPSSISNDWAIGRTVTSFTFPQTFTSPSVFPEGGVTYGILDDFSAYKDTSNVVGSGPPIPATVDELQSIIAPNVVKLWGLALNEGQGNVLVTSGARLAQSFLFPEEGDGVGFDIGLVEPEDPPRGTMLYDYRRIGADGVPIRQLLAIQGTTLHRIDREIQNSVPIYGNLPKGGIWSFDQYADLLFLTCRNGQRPYVYDGTVVRRAGVRAPLIAPTAVSSNAGGTLADGTYHLYYTYRNPDTGVESNPSPSVTFTISGGGTGSVTDLGLDISRDPQVTERRVWITAPNGGEGSTAFLAATIPDNVRTSLSSSDPELPITSLPQTPILEYVDNHEALVSRIVSVFKDRLYLGGTPDTPTRVYYSRAGELESFNISTGFEDADADQGDVITNLVPLLDQLIAYLEDGRVSLTTTGDPNQPHILSFKSRDVGCVGPQAAIIFEANHFFLGERDFYIWDGSNSANLSSPNDPDRPSIKFSTRNLIDPATRGFIVMSRYLNRDQVWFSVVSSENAQTEPAGQVPRNDIVYVYDYSQGVWSRYRMDVDFLAEIEDENGDPTMYGISRGFVVQLDTGVADGQATPIPLTATGGNTFRLISSGAGLTPDRFKGLYCHVYDVTGNTVARARILRNTADELVFAEAISIDVDAGDRCVIAGIPWFADFIVDVGNPMELKKLHFFKTSGTADTDTDFFLEFFKNNKSRTLPSAPTDFFRVDWLNAEDHKDILIGGIGRAWRFRLSETGYDFATRSGFPAVSGGFELHEFQVELNVVDAR